MKLPPITPRQQDILTLLYRYRYLNRIHIQALLNQHNKKRTIYWLQDLRTKGYINWIYSTHFLEKTKPAVYFLGPHGIRALRAANTYAEETLRLRYKDTHRSEAFITRSQLIAECCITLLAAHEPATSFSFATPADYADPANPWHFLHASTISPHLCFTKHATASTHYLVDVLDSVLTRYQIGYRLTRYIDFLEDETWQQTSQMQGSGPIILFVCPAKADLISAKRRARQRLEDRGLPDLPLRFATQKDLRVYGITGEIWEDC